MTGGCQGFDLNLTLGRTYVLGVNANDGFGCTLGTPAPFASQMTLFPSGCGTALTSSMTGVLSYTPAMSGTYRLVVCRPGCGAGSQPYQVSYHAGRTAFFTSSIDNGDIGSLAAADNLCRLRAGSAGLPNASGYKAWLSDSTASPSTRFDLGGGPFVRTDGVAIANNWSDLTDATLAAPINHDESGSTSTGCCDFCFTATQPNGTGIGPGNYCNDWTSSGTGSLTFGRPSRSDAGWTASNAFSCNAVAHLYCFEQ